MTQYCLVNAQHTEVLDGPRDLPPQWEAEDGQQILNFDKSDEPELFNWLPFTAEPQPEFDPYTKNLRLVMVIGENEVTGHWAVDDKSTDDLVNVLAGMRAQKQQAIADKYAEVISAGFPVNFGSVEAPLNDSLQIRNDTDRTNWLGLKDLCRDMIAAGAGDQLSALPIRATSNQQYEKTYNEIAAMLTQMLMWIAYHQGVYWQLKDAANAAVSVAQLQAIDEQNWPVFGS